MQCRVLANEIRFRICTLVALLECEVGLTKPEGKTGRQVLDGELAIHLVHVRESNGHFNFAAPATRYMKGANKSLVLSSNLYKPALKHLH